MSPSAFVEQSGAAGLTGAQPAAQNTPPTAKCTATATATTVATTTTTTIHRMPIYYLEKKI